MFGLYQRFARALGRTYKREKKKNPSIVCMLPPTIWSFHSPPKVGGEAGGRNETNSLGKILIHIFQVLTPALDTELRSGFLCRFPAKLIF